MLILDGEAGIGKTTLCQAAAQSAAAAGFTVLRATGAAAEVTLTWAALADLLAGIEPLISDRVSPLHQRALEAVINGTDVPGGDERLLGTAVRAALEQQSRQLPLALVIDDAQWVDDASKLVLGFALRRLIGPIAIVAAYRSGEPGGIDRTWVEPSDPRGLTRLSLAPMGAASLRELLQSRLGDIPPGLAFERIERLSGGNPFYALELARALRERPGSESDSLPPTLAELVSGRIGEVDAETAQAMITAAVAFEPTVDIVAAVTGQSPSELVDTLAVMESRAVITYDGPRILFEHPLIASGVIANADPAAVRRAHGRLADVIEHPEARARHMALSTPHGDAETLAALDTAAEAAAERGAYVTARELLMLAINRGGDNHWRRLRGADFAFRSGALDDAKKLLEPILDALPAGFLRAAGLLLLAAIHGYHDGLASAIPMFERAFEEASDDPIMRTQALLMLALATGIGGDMAKCVQLARRARADAEATGADLLRSQALALWTHVSFMYGLGTDYEALETALEIGLPDTAVPIMLRPKPIHAVNRAWTGRLDEAHEMLVEVSTECTELGNEIDALWADEQLTMIEIGLGRYADAERTAANALHRAHLIGGRLPLITGYTAVANVAAHRGRLEETRSAAEFAVKAATEAGLYYMVRHPLMSLAFAQVSERQYDEALETLKPLIDTFDPDHETEIETGAWLPDAVQAMASLGRTEEAEPLVAALEANGARHNRPWMLAVGARCRSLLRAANRDLDEAIACAETALVHHDRLPMPFERARTQLLLGQLQRRRRRTAAAKENICKAAVVFEEIGSPLWAARAKRELSRLPAKQVGDALTESERQVARYAAAGLTNKQIASELYLSAKTVEMYLSSTYRKLGISSRTQLANRLRESESTDSAEAKESPGPTGPEI